MGCYLWKEMFKHIHTSLAAQPLAVKSKGLVTCVY